MTDTFIFPTRDAARKRAAVLRAYDGRPEYVHLHADRNADGHYVQGTVKATTKAEAEAGAAWLTERNIPYTIVETETDDMANTRRQEMLDEANARIDGDEAESTSATAPESGSG